jgi:hypothetical protein
VDKLRWMSTEVYTELFALAQCMPGPASTQVRAGTFDRSGMTDSDRVATQGLARLPARPNAAASNPPSPPPSRPAFPSATLLPHD